MTNDNELLYKTSDLCLITTLSLYSSIESIDKNDPNRFVFIFQRTKEFENLLSSYWHGELRIEPKHFFNQLKTIKSRIYAND